jgi:hypothetical protein
MTKLFSLLTLVFSLGAQANTASIQCTASNGKTVSVANNQDTDLFWENCQTELFEGNVCFKGKRSEAMEVLSYLSSMDVLGDEYRIINTWYVGSDKIKYEVFDGPNQIVAAKNIISRCD